jgi:hypothetical protein
VNGPTLRAAAGLGGRALVRSGWLVAGGLAVALARRALLLPGVVVAWALLWSAVGSSPAAQPAAGVLAALAVATSPGFLLLVAGLWLAGVALGAVLRVAWVTGALATLGPALAGSPASERRFAPAVAYDLPRVLATALLAWGMELAGAGFALALAIGAGRLIARSAGQGASALLAAATAGALTLAVAVPFALSVAADAAVARAVLRGEGPAAALAGAAARLVGRPGAFLAAALAFGALGLAAVAIVEALGGVATGWAAGAPPLLLLGPQLLVATAVATAGAAIELWWLGTVAVLACRD